MSLTSRPGAPGGREARPPPGQRTALLAVVASVTLGYVGPAWLAAVPVAAAAVYLVVFGADAGRYRLAGLAALGTLYLLAAASSLVLPSPAAPGLLRSMAASIALAAALAFTPASMTVRPMFAIGTAAAVAMLGWLLVRHPMVLSAKSAPLAAVLGFQAGGVQPSALSGNAVGVLAAIGAAGWVALAAVARDWRRRAPAALAAAPAVGVLLLSNSRGAMLALALAAGAAAAWRFAGGRWLLVGGASLLLVAGGLATGAAPAGLLTHAGDAMLTTRDWGDAERLQVWRGAVLGAMRSPLLGTGIGSFPFAFVHAAPDPPDPIGAHNTFLEAWVDLGLGAVAVMIALTIGCLARCVRLGRRPLEPAMVGTALLTWLVASTFESTVFASWVERGPWIGWHEVAQPLAFALWGMAMAPLAPAGRPVSVGARSGRAAERVMVPAALGVLVSVTPLAAGVGPSWGPPGRITEGQVRRAADDWLVWCARAAAPLTACPQRARDLPGGRAAEFAWAPGSPVSSHVRVSWSRTEGVFVVEGLFTMRYRHWRPAGDRPGLYAGDLRGYFVAGLRPRTDARSFGAYSLDGRVPTVDGFAVVSSYTWELRCCPGSDLVPAGAASPRGFDKP